MAVAEAVKTGKVVQVIGPVVDIEFAGGTLPAIYNAVRITGEGRRRHDRHRRRGRAAPRREPRAHGRDEADRRLAARHDRDRPGRADFDAGRPRTRSAAC